MKLVDSSRRPAGVVRCLFGACSFPDPCSSCSSGIAPCPDGRLSRPVGVAEVDKKGCGQCPHFPPRIGPYRGRIGPDSVCFRGCPVFTRARMQFESHLGHA
jgi:hypothetical protein